MGDSAKHYEVIVDRESAKMLRHLAPSIARRVIAALHALEDEPRPRGCIKLTGHDLWRIRVGDWRVTYSIQDDQLIVLIVEIASRGNAYREL